MDHPWEYLEVLGRGKITPCGPSCSPLWWNVLVVYWKKVHFANLIHGGKLGNGGLEITHLQFEDDTLAFYGALTQGTELSKILLNILHFYGGF